MYKYVYDFEDLGSFKHTAKAFKKKIGNWNNVTALHILRFNYNLYQMSVWFANNKIIDEKKSKKKQMKKKKKSFEHKTKMQILSFSSMLHFVCLASSGMLG